MEVAQSRSRLWSLVSHELRTPLTIIKSSAQLLRRGGAEHQERFAEKIVCQTDHLQLLIEDLIALCLLQSGVGISEAKEIDVMELVNEICKQMERDGVQISVVKRDPLAPIVAERSLLHRAIRHLVDNAVKFSPPGSEVRVELATGPSETTRISIVDEGEGISSDALERLKQSFVQEQDPLNRDVDGLGIGLSLGGHEIVSAHGGRLSVDSTGGRGSRFTVEIPRVQGAERPKTSQERSIRNG